MATTKEIWSKLPDKASIQTNINEFYRFMYERHSIWFRRFVLRQPPPWTKDRVLRDHRFTNVYRELDHGTIWYLSHVWPDAKRHGGDLNVLWETIIYRIINRVETFEKVGFVPINQWTRKNSAAWYQKLEKLHEQEAIFTSAHITLPTGVGMKLSRLEKLQKEVLSYTAKNIKKLKHDLKAAASLEQAFNVLRRIPCVGPFIAYEICCDLMYIKFLKFTENDWVNPGPGCKLGLRLMFPRAKGDFRFQALIRMLQQDQQKHFKRLKLTFPYFYPRKRLTLRSIEHSLCEYSKYYRLKRTTAGKNRRFAPRDWPNSTGQLPFRFPRL